jgi:hypothetical protein
VLERANFDAVAAAIGAEAADVPGDLGAAMSGGISAALALWVRD